MVNEYVRVADGDMELMANIFQQMRGRRTVQEYSMDCGYAGRTFTRITGKERMVNHIKEDMVEAALAQKDPKADYAEGQVMATNGCLKESILDALVIHEMTSGIGRDADKGGNAGDGDIVPGLCQFDNGLVSLNMDWQPSTAKGKKSPGHASLLVDAICGRLSEKEKEEVKYVGFLLDLSKFSLTLDQKECNALKMHTRKLFEDVFFCAMLKKYCELVKADEEADLKELRRFFKGERTDAPEWAHESKAYFDVMVDILFSCAGE